MTKRKRLVRMAALVASLTGCASTREAFDPEYVEVTWNAHRACQYAQPPEATLNPTIAELSGPHSVVDYLEFALAQNAGVQAARKRVEAAAMRVPQAASLNDPRLSVTPWPFYPYVPQTAGGRVTADISLSQEIPWSGKLDADAQAAAAEVDMARARLAVVEFEVIAQVKRAYYQLGYLEESLRITNESRQLLADVMRLAEVRYTAGRTSQQDVLRLQAELANVDVDVVRLQQELAASRAELGQLLHVSPDIPFETLGEFNLQRIPEDLESLYQQAITARPELHEQLAAIRRDRFKVERARLEYYPDIMYGAQWGAMTTNRALAPTADGLDMVGLNLSCNLPIYGNRIRAGIRESEFSVVASAREYDQLKDQTLRDVKALFTQAQSQQEIAELFRSSIIPKTQQSLDVSMSEYEVGTLGFVQLIDNWRSLLRVQLLVKQTEMQLGQTLAELEQVVGGFAVTYTEVPTPGVEQVVAPPISSAIQESN